MAIMLYLVTYLINCMDFLWQPSFLCSRLGTLNKNNLLALVISAEFKVQKPCKRCLIAHRTVINATQANKMNRLRLQMKKHNKFDYLTCICCLCVVLFVNQASLHCLLLSAFSPVTKSTLAWDRNIKQMSGDRQSNLQGQNHRRDIWSQWSQGNLRNFGRSD